MPNTSHAGNDSPAQTRLRELQQVYRRHKYLVEILKHRQTSFPGSKAATTTPGPGGASGSAGSVTIPEHIEEPSQPSWAERIHESFLERASDEGRDILVNRLDIAVGVLENASMNASAIRVADAPTSWVIAFNEGLSSTIYAVARALFAALNMNASDGSGPASPATIDFEQAGRILFERLNCYIHTGVPLGPDYAINTLNMNTASMIATMGERFVYCHELSHILLGHHPSATFRPLAGDWGKADEAVHPEDKELQADVLSWQLMVQIFVRRASELQFAYAGGVLFLKIAGILESAGDAVSPTTHPPAARRLANLRQAMMHTAAEVKAPEGMCENIADGLAESLDKALATTGRLPGPCPVRELIERCSRGMIPDYMSFQQEMLYLLSFSAPSKLCRTLGHQLAEATHELEPLEAQAASLSEEQVRSLRPAYNRMKLINGLLWLYLTPEISRHIEKHRDRRLQELRKP